MFLPLSKTAVLFPGATLPASSAAMPTAPPAFEYDPFLEISVAYAGGDFLFAK